MAGRGKDPHIRTEHRKKKKSLSPNKRTKNRGNRFLSRQGSRTQKKERRIPNSPTDPKRQGRREKESSREKKGKRVHAQHQETAKWAPLEKGGKKGRGRNRRGGCCLADCTTKTVTGGRYCKESLMPKKTNYCVSKPGGGERGK